MRQAWWESSIWTVARRQLASCHRIATRLMQAIAATNLVPIETTVADPATFKPKTPGFWLKIKSEQSVAGKWIRIAYSLSIYDDLVRPVIQFRTATGDRLELLPAPLFGSSIWIGHVPSDTTEIYISPTGGSSCNGFRIDALSTLPAISPFVLAAGRDPRRVVDAILAACSGSRSKARDLLYDAIRKHPLERYDSWRRNNLRAIEPDGLDRFGHDRRNGPSICVVVDVKHDHSEQALSATLSALAGQDYDRWSVAVVTSSERLFGLVNELLGALSGRAIHVRPEGRTEILWKQLADDAFVAPLAVGATMPSYALSAVASFSLSNPGYEVIYADEDHIDCRGEYHSPLLKPDWSPMFQWATNYIGRAIYLRRSLLSRCQTSLSQIDFRSILNEITLSPAIRVGHLRRVLLTSPVQHVSERADCTSPRPPMAAHLNAPAPKPLATLIIPCRDNPDLLEACLRSLERTDPTSFDIIIVENGSEQKETFSLYNRLQSDARVRILLRPGAFNFSALCNSAAEEVTTPVMVFLNNDTIIQEPDWLDELTAWALQPNIGAVGTKLIYPSHLLQHAGAVVGLAGYAAHSDRNAKVDTPGYMHKLAATREVSAVTGACLAIEKAKFDHVGGFDGQTFPIELSDMDICLRLRAAGWTTICLSEPILIHHESATRGTPQDLDIAYAAERRAFRDRWYSYIRDDPYYHPALSLHSNATALDR